MEKFTKNIMIGGGRERTSTEGTTRAKLQNLAYLDNPKHQRNICAH